MASLGSAGIKPKKHKALPPDALDGAAHPRFFRTGHRYVPRRNGARAGTITCVLPGGEWCLGPREFDAGRCPSPALPQGEPARAERQPAAAGPGCDDIVLLVRRASWQRRAKDDSVIPGPARDGAASGTTRSAEPASRMTG